MDILGTILWPLKWLVELVLVAWHTVLTAFGLPTAAGITWVLAIVGLVVVVRAALIPLFVKQIKSQRKMMEIAPELRKVQEKYKGKRDQLSREAMSRETMALYKKHGTTPVSSCLPLLVQMPVFFSLYSVLSTIKQHAEAGIGGVGLLSPELTQEFYDAKLFGVSSLHGTLIDAFNGGDTTSIVILIVLVALMIGSQFFTQLQIISKNLSPEAKTGQAYQLQKIMLYILPLGFIFSGVFFPLGVVIYWFISNLWTMVQQFLVIRNMPTPGSEAAKMREERLAKKGKALDAKGRIIPLAKYEAEQQKLYEEAERARAAAPKRQQPVGKQRSKKQAQGGQTRPPAVRPQAAPPSTPAPSSSSSKDAVSRDQTKPAAPAKPAKKDVVVKRDAVVKPQPPRPVDGTSPA